MNNKNYLLRAATMEDYNFIYHVKKVTLKKHIDRIWGWDEEYQQNDFRECFNPQNNKVIIYDNENIGVLEISYGGNIIHIVELEILPKYQGKGIGGAIIKDIIKNAHSTGKNVKIGCFKINIDAKGLYERLGFKVIEETETHYILKS